MPRPSEFEAGQKQVESRLTFPRRAFAGAVGKTVSVGFCKQQRNAANLTPPIESASERGSMARKRYQKGQLWLEGKTWYGRWREDVVEDGKVRRVRRKAAIGSKRDYPTKRLAQRAFEDQIAHVNRISYRPMPTAKFRDFAESWKTKVLSQYGESTAINYRTHIRKHLVPFFGGYPMKDLNSEMIQQFVSSSTATAKTTRNICITLRSMLTTAKAWGYIAQNVMDGVVLPDVKRVQRFFLSQKEIQLILAEAAEPERTWYGLAAETGLRAGELCGLTVDDLDLEHGTLQVRQSAWRGKLGEPKTEDSIRVVELSPQACWHLKQFLASWHPNEWRLLFATRNGTPWDQNLLLKRKFKPLLLALNIQVPRGNGFHAFRHANATLMSSFGASQKLRQQRLGHADGSPVTETIYTHVISEDGKRVAAQLGNAVWGILDPIGPKKENGPGVEPPKPFVIN
jgi:ATP-dependent helicase/nuclease subunit A